MPLHRVLALVLLSVCAGGFARAARAAEATPCDDAVLEAVAAHDGIADLRHAARDDDAGPGLVVAEDCRIWPHAPDIRLAAFAWVRSAAEVSPGERDLQLVVAMLDDDGRVLAEIRDDLPEDAVTRIEQGSLRLDTAAYDLAPGVRAIGLGIDSIAPGPSCPEGLADDELRLFVRDGGTLRQVLSVYREDWVQVSGSVCNAREASVVESARISVGVEKTRSHGYADLRLIAAVERDETAAADPAADSAVEGPPETRSTTRRASRVLHYDGRQYRPDGYNALHFWTSDE